MEEITHENYSSFVAPIAIPIICPIWHA